MSRNCSFCHLPGHNVRTCPEKKKLSAAPDPPSSTLDESPSDESPASDVPAPVPTPTSSSPESETLLSAPVPTSSLIADLESSNPALLQDALDVALNLPSPSSGEAYSDDSNPEDSLATLASPPNNSPNPNPSPQQKSLPRPEIPSDKSPPKPAAASASDLATNPNLSKSPQSNLQNPNSSSFRFREDVLSHKNSRSQSNHRRSHSPAFGGGGRGFPSSPSFTRDKFRSNRNLPPRRVHSLPPRRVSNPNRNSSQNRNPSSQDILSYPRPPIPANDRYVPPHNRSPDPNPPLIPNDQRYPDHASPPDPSLPYTHNHYQPDPYHIYNQNPHYPYGPVRHYPPPSHRFSHPFHNPYTSHQQPFHHQFPHPPPPPPSNPQPQPPPPPQHTSPAAPPPPMPPSEMDPSTGIIRPPAESIRRLESRGLRGVYAIAWLTGGGIYLTEADALDARAHISTLNLSPSQVRSFSHPDCCLSENIALATEWVRSPSTPTTPNTPAAPAASSASAPPSTTAPPPSSPPPNPGTPQPQTPPNPPPPPQSAYTPSPQANPPTPQPSPPNPTTTSTNPTTEASAAPPSSTATLVSANEWAFSQNDVLVRRHLLDARLPPIEHQTRTPSPNRLHYIAAPGTSRGIIVDYADAQRVVMDPITGTMVLKPKHLPTLQLLDFTAFLSLMFRASDMIGSLSSPAATKANTAIQILVRDLTRQYESFAAAGEPPELWLHNAYLRWTHTVQTRILMTGFSAEMAFEKEARLRIRNSPSPSRRLTLGSPTPAHATARTQNHSSSSRTSSAYWFICPCCAKVNDHFSPSCPTQTEGPSPVSEKVRKVTKTAINNADIPDSAKTELRRMCASLYAKIDRSQ